VLKAPCYVISDTHVGAPEAAGIDRTLLAFLENRRAEAAAGRPGSLVINGDLFEFWYEWRTVMPRSAFRVAAALAALHDAGTEILWIAGNHDCWGGDIIREDIGAEYHVGPWVGTLAGWRARVEHGDGLRAVEDRRYRALRWSVLRNPVAVRAFRWLPPDLATRIALLSSHTSRTTRARDGGEGLRRIALNHLAGMDGVEQAPELVILGHSHFVALERAPSGGVYANPGTWLADPTFLRITPALVELRQWDGSPDGRVVNALDRPSATATQE
jgi:UDP-2,3-diacylglucosamine hydrolase